MCVNACVGVSGECIHDSPTGVGPWSTVTAVTVY